MILKSKTEVDLVLADEGTNPCDFCDFDIEDCPITVCQVLDVIEPGEIKEYYLVKKGAAAYKLKRGK